MTIKTKTFVGFVADFPTDGDPESPPGKELAEFINSELMNSNWSLNKPSNREGWAWHWTSTQDDITILTIVGLVDDMELTPPRQWLITNEINTPLLKKLLGGKKMRLLGNSRISKYCNQMHDVISSNPKFSSVLWYDAETFDMENDLPGSRP